jgi:hypothetical protein
MQVHILVTADILEDVPLTTLFKSTIRTGFPTADIHVWDNASEQQASVIASTDGQAFYHRLDKRQHLACWIKWVINSVPPDEPLAIVDPDTIWWKSVEWFDLSSLWAGFYQPYAWIEWTNTLGAPRLHTHFLYIPSPARLREAIAEVNFWSGKPCEGYRKMHLFMSNIQWMNGHAIFFDVCAQLYNAIGGTPFEEGHLQCYDHINSASFKRYVKFEKQEGFNLVHELARTNPAALRGFYKEMVVYWRQMHHRALNFAKMPRMHNMFPLPGYDPHATGAY